MTNEKNLGADAAVVDLAGSIASDAAIARHTPGPWHVFYKRKYDEWHVSLPCEDSNMCVALCSDGVPGSTQEECGANAHLIAAAPELLGEHRAWAQMFGEALVLAMQGDYSKVDELARVARIHCPDGSPELVSEAIAKAEGRS